MFDHVPALSPQLHASFGAMIRCPRCDVVGATDIKSIHPGLCGNDIIVYQCHNCGAEHAGNAGSDPVLHMS